MKRLIIVTLVFLHHFAYGQVSISQIVTPISYSSSLLTLEFQAGFTFGPPAPPFLGAWVSGVNNDTLLVHPLYNAVGQFGQFTSGRFDTIILNIPSGINYVFVHSGIRKQNANIMDYDTTYAFNNETLVLSTLNINNLDLNSKVTLYPNPVYDYLLLNTNENFKVLNWNVYTISGQNILQSNMSEEMKINFSELAKGTYLLKVNTTKGIIRKKVVKM